MKCVVTTSLCILLSLTLMPGLGGCANNRCDADEGATQPQPSSTQPAKGQSAKTCEEVKEEIVTTCDERHPVTRQMDRQVHNAELADMCLTDVHFLPNRAMLSSNGTQRLNHLAWLVERYGGSIKLDLEQPDCPVAKERVQTVVDYLRAWGLPDKQIHVCLGLPDSRGMQAKEAIVIHNDTRFKSKEQSAYIAK